MEAEDVDELAHNEGRFATFAEWADMILARLAAAPNRSGRSAVDLVIEERRRRGDKLFEDHIRRVSESG